MQKLTIKLAITCCVFLTTINVFSQNYKFGKVSKEEVLQKAHSIEPDANAAILYRDLKTKFNYSQDEGFYIVTYVHERVKIYNKDGFNWATKRANLYQGSKGNKEKLSGLKGYTYFMKDGKLEDVKLKSDGIFDEEVSEFLNRTKFTMPNISEGCVIEYKYEIKSSFIDNIDEYRLQEKIPIDRVEVTFSVPEYLNYKTYQKGAIPFKIEADASERKMSFSSTVQGNRGPDGDGITRTRQNEVVFTENKYDVEMTNVPAIKEEPYAGNIDNYTASLKFELSYTQYPQSGITTYSTSWEAVSKSIYENPRFRNQIERTSYFKEDLDALLSGISNPDEKLIKIFDLVKRKVTWNDYYGYYPNKGAKEAYKEGTGNAADINLLLVSMLKYAGLDANPILVSTKSNGIPIFPTRNGFNFVIAGVEKKNEVLLLDATNKLGEVNVLESGLLNWQGRIIRDGGSSAFVPLYPSTASMENALVSIDLNEDLSATGTYQSRFTEHYALSKRNQFAGTTDETKRKRIEKSLGETEVSNIEFENLDVLYQPVKLSYEFEAFDAAEEIGGKLYLTPMLFLAMKKNPFTLEKRDYPIDYNHPFKDRYMITINIPEGYAIENMPEGTSVALPSDGGSFRYAATAAGNKIQLSVELAINQPLLPASYYDGLKQFYQLVIDKENEKIVLIKE